MNRKHFLVMCQSDPSGIGRPNRIIQLLYSLGYKVDVLSFPIKLNSNLPIDEHFILNRIRSRKNIFFRIFHGIYIRFIYFIRKFIKSKSLNLWFVLNFIEIQHNHAPLKRVLKDKNYDVLVVEDLFLLPLAFQIRSKEKILFDVREYFTKQTENDYYFRKYHAPIREVLCRHYLPMCDKIFTVSPGLAKKYHKEFAVEMEVLLSTPYYVDLPVKNTQENEIKMVHHGLVSNDRGIDKMIEVVKKLDNRFMLDLYLVGDTSYINELRSKAKGCNRIRFCEPVPFDEIVPMLNQYDIGFFYVEPTTFNLLHCLPNKLFEFIQGRLAIAIGPSPDMAKIVQDYNVGFISSEFTLNSMIERLSTLSIEEIDKAKENSDLASRELCYEREGEKLIKIINQLLN